MICSASPGVVGPGAARLQINGCAVVRQSILQALQLVVAGRPVVQRPAVLWVNVERPRVVCNCSLKVPLHCSDACIKPALLSCNGPSSGEPRLCRSSKATLVYRCLWRPCKRNLPDTLRLCVTPALAEQICSVSPSTDLNCVKQGSGLHDLTSFRSA